MHDGEDEDAIRLDPIKKTVRETGNE